MIHECQCPDHDCQNPVACERPAICGRATTSLHLCAECGPCAECASVVIHCAVCGDTGVAGECGTCCVGDSHGIDCQRYECACGASLIPSGAVCGAPMSHGCNTGACSPECEEAAFNVSNGEDF